MTKIAKTTPIVTLLMAVGLARQVAIEPDGTNLGVPREAWVAYIGHLAGKNHFRLESADRLRLNLGG